MTECKAGTYKDNSVILHGPIVCWGFEQLGQPQCKYLIDCIYDYQKDLPKRKFNSLLNRVKKG